MKLLSTIDTAWDYAAAHVASVVSRYPKTLAGAVSIGLAGFAATAFGVAPMVPDASALPKRTVVEDVSPADLVSQLEALADHDLALFRDEITRSGDTADSLLSRLSVSDAAAASFLRADPVARKLLDGRGGKRVQVRVDSTGKLEELIARYAAPGGDKLPTQFTRLRVERVGGQLVAYTVLAPLTSQPIMASGTIRQSLFAATDEAGIPDSVATQLAEVFATDIDFRRELKKGATFSLVYEALAADGEAITWGPANAGLRPSRQPNQKHSAIVRAGRNGGISARRQSSSARSSRPLESAA